MAKNNANNQNGLRRVGEGFWDTLVMSRTERINKINKDVHQYAPSRIENFFVPGEGVNNMVISGGYPDVRNAIVLAQVENAVNYGYPVIVLHEGNSSLERTIRNVYGFGNCYEEIGCQSPCFEPMYGLTGLEISNEVVESTPKDFDMKFNVKYYLDGVASLMNKMGKSTSFNMYATCPHTKIFDVVDKAQNNGQITDDQANEIRSKLMMGQSENFKLESALANLEQEMSPILWKKGMGHNPVNIISAVKNKKILCFDVLAMSNQMLANVITYQLKLALTRGMNYALIMDSLSIEFNESMKKFIQMNSNKVPLTVSADDLYALVGGEEKLFDTFVGNSRLSVIMAHKSASSAKRWAEVIGQYDAWIESYNTNYGSQSNPHELLNSHNRSSGTTTSKNREYKVKPEQISGMNGTEAYIISMSRNETAHIELII